MPASDPAYRVAQFMLRAKITGTGCFTPERRLTNDDLSTMVETSDTWIMERTGIRERRIADGEIATSDMAVAAGKRALDAAGVPASELDAILVCTVTPDTLFPSTACLVQDRLGANKAWGFDLVAACSGFVYGLTVAANFVGTGTHRKVLVVGSDTMSRIIDYTDRATCVLFGDAAGAFLVEQADSDEEAGFLGHLNSIDGTGGPFLCMPAGGSRLPASENTVAQRLHYVKQDGSPVFKFAVRRLSELCEQMLRELRIDRTEIKLMIPHQANIRIIRAVAERLGLREDQVMVNLDRYGNTTAATIPLATCEAVEQGRLQRGDLVLFAAVGAGYTAGVNVWRWSF